MFRFWAAIYLRWIAINIVQNKHDYSYQSILKQNYSTDYIDYYQIRVLLVCIFIIYCFILSVIIEQFFIYGIDFSP